MAAPQLLTRNIRAQRPTVEGDDVYGSDHGDASPSEDDIPDQEQTGVNGIDSESASDDDRGEQEDFPGDFSQSIGHVSFGALKQAQDAYSRKRKRDSDNAPDQEQKLQALRARLQQIKDEKNGNTSTRTGKGSKAESKRQRHGDRVENADEDSRSEGSDSDSDSAPSEEGAGTQGRSSKHAPTAQSSRRQVTRKRTVIEVPKSVIRDPRFDAVSGRAPQNAGNIDKAYEFLRDYQKSEIAELQAAIKRSKNDQDKETLRRKMVSMQNRLKAKEDSERRQAVLRRHRKEEREKVLQGKTPFYIKKKALKEAALVEKFNEMKGKDRQKLMDRRRKKESQKEKKRMPDARRLTT